MDSIIIGLLLSVGLPIQIYFASRKNYRSNERINEIINYEFDSEHISANWGIVQLKTYMGQDL